MPTVTITRNDEGKIVGIDEKDVRAYAKLKRMLETLTPKESLTLKFWVPRSPRFHRYHFAVLNAVFNAQERFDDPEDMRKWIEVGSGHCHFVPGPTGGLVAIPLSIAYEKLDDMEFREHHEAVKRFLRTTHATRFLWSNLDDKRGFEMIESILSSSDQP